MSCLPEKARWRIAHLLEYRPGWCWTSLAFDGTRAGLRHANSLAALSRACTQEAATR